MQQTQPGPQHFVFYGTVIIIIGLQTTTTVSWDFGSCEIMMVTYMNFVINKKCAFYLKLKHRNLTTWLRDFMGGGGWSPPLPFPSGYHLD